MGDARHPRVYEIGPGIVRDGACARRSRPLAAPLACEYRIAVRVRDGSASAICRLRPHAASARCGGAQSDSLMSRDAMLHNVRTALGRSAGQAAGRALRPCACAFRAVDRGTADRDLASALEALAGKTYRVPSRARRASVRRKSPSPGKTAVRLERALSARSAASRAWRERAHSGITGGIARARRCAPASASPAPITRLADTGYPGDARQSRAKPA